MKVSIKDIATMFKEVFSEHIGSDSLKSIELYADSILLKAKIDCVPCRDFRACFEDFGRTISKLSSGKITMVKYKIDKTTVIASFSSDFEITEEETKPIYYIDNKE